MPRRLTKFALIGIAFLLAVSATATQPEPPAPPDPADDPLPEGAKTRFGVTRPILRTGPAVAILPPKFTDFLAPTVSNGVRRYHLGTGRPFEKVKKGVNEIGPGRVVASADGKRAVVVRAGTLTVVEAATGKFLNAVKPPEGVVLQGLSGASFSGDGKTLAYGGRGPDGKGMVVVWDLVKDEQVALIETEQKPPVSPTLSRDGKTLVTHGPTPAAPRIVLNPADGPKDPVPEPDPARAAQVWDVETGKELFKAQVSGMGGMVVASAFSPDGTRVAVSAADGPVDVWDVKAGKRMHTLLGRKGQGVRVAFSADGKKVASIGPDYRTQMWTAADGKQLGVYDPPPGILIAQISGFEFADNDLTVAWVTAAQFCVAWEAPTGRLLSPLMEHAAAIRTVAFPENEKDFFTSGSEGRVFRWDRPTGLLNEQITLRPARLPGQPPVRPVVNLSADGTRATWLRSPTEVFDVASGGDLFIAPSPSTPPAAVSHTLSPDGLKVIICSRQSDNNPTGAVVVWDLVAEKRVAEFEIPASANAGAPVGALSPDNTRLVVMTSRHANGRDVLLIVGYDLKTGKKLAEVEDPAGLGSMHLAAVNDTAAVLASTNGRVWAVDYVNGKVGEEIDKLPTRGETAVYCPVAVSPDGKMLATGLLGAEPEVYGVRVYDWPRGKPLHTFMGHVGPVTALRFSPDSKGLASGAQDTSVLLWDLTKIGQKKEEKEDKDKE